MDEFKRYIEIPFEPINTLTSWEEFKTENQRLLQFLKDLEKTSGFPISSPRYRGHADSNWKLQTTLERATGNNDFPILEYFDIAQKTFQELSPLHDSIYLSRFDANKSLRDFSSLTNPQLQPNGLDILSDLAFLRHHGFPSPLLDWTLSEKIAAFFAFQSYSNSEYVSIYVLVEYIHLGKMVSSTKPRIEGIRNDIQAHSRHQKQNSEYTACLINIDSNQYFTSHDSLLANNTKAQDVTLKFNIPAKERTLVLNELRSGGIVMSELMSEKTPQTLLHDISTRYF